MSTASQPTSIRLTPAEKKRIAAAARKRGLTPAAYIKHAALGELASAPDDERLARLERLAEAVREAVEDEIDAREAAAAWERHVKNKTRLFTPEEAKRELGL